MGIAENFMGHLDGCGKLGPNRGVMILRLFAVALAVSVGLPAFADDVPLPELTPKAPTTAKTAR